MKTTEIQEFIVEKVLQSNDSQMLNYLHDLLNNDGRKDPHSAFYPEKFVFSERQAQYLPEENVPNEIIFYQNVKWMSE